MLNGNKAREFNTSTAQTYVRITKIRAGTYQSQFLL